MESNPGPTASDRLLAHLWRWLTEPAVPITEPDLRRRVKLLASLLIFFIPAALLVTTLSILFEQGVFSLSDPGTGMVAGASALLLFAYFLNRGGYYRQASLLTLAVQSAAVFLVALTESEGGQWLIYLTVPVVLSTALLSLRASAAFITANLLVALLLALFALDRHAFSVSGGVVLITAGLILVATHHRNRLEQERQERLLRLEERFSKAFHASPTALVITTLNEGRFVDMNEHFLRLVGYERDELMGRTTSEVDIFQDLPDRARIVAMLRERGAMYDIETQWRNKSGHLLDILTSGEVIELDGEPCILGMGIDIGRRKQLEQEQAERQRLQVALEKEREFSDLKTRLMTLANHEFRTPLSIILASSELLELYYDRLTEEKRASFFSAIRAQVKSVSAMLDDMTTILDVEGGKLMLAPEPHDLDVFCRERVSEIQNSLGAQHRLNFSSEGDLAAIPIEENLFDRILRNLLSNAIKYSPKGSEVCVALRRNGSDVVLSVTDQGIGIPLKDQKRIFEPYHRAENVVNIPGIGLGLKIVKDFVTLHNGTISFTSEEGKGTTFTVRLPVQANGAAT